MRRDDQETHAPTHCPNCLAPFKEWAHDSMPRARRGIAIYECGNSSDPNLGDGMFLTLACARNHDKTFEELKEVVAATLGNEERFGVMEREM